MTGDDRNFAALLEKERVRLASFVLAVAGDRHAADDLLQATCLELWRIRRTFRPGTDFGAWSRTVARYQIMRYFRKRHREKVTFSSEAIDRIADAYAAPAATDDEALRGALEQCLDLVPTESRALLRERYNHDCSIRTLAERSGRTEAGIKMALLRLRRQLADCIASRLRGKEPSDATGRL